MKEAEVEIILERGQEKFPQARPRIISDNGPQLIARDFKEFMRLCGMTHVRTPPFYPQSNGKIARWHRSLKGECLRPGVPGSADGARSLVAACVDHYNRVSLQSAIGYVAPLGKWKGAPRRSGRSAVRNWRKRKNNGNRGASRPKPCLGLASEPKPVASRRKRD
jgi:putative transposase